MLFQPAKTSLCATILAVALGVAAGFAAINPSASVSATTDSTDSAESAQEVGVGIKPPSITVDLHPGQVTTGSFKVSNTGTLAYDYRVYPTPYSILNSDYSIDYDRQTSYTMLSNWIIVTPETGHLESGRSVEIYYTITVPTDVPNAGQYATIMVAADAHQDSIVNPISRAGTIIYGHTIGGETNRCAAISNNKVRSILFAPPITATSMVENCGNIDGNATYAVTITSLFGGKPVYDNSSDPAVATILPETSRIYTITWDEAPAFGLFWVNQEVRIFDQVSTVRQLVLICPIWLIVLIAIFVLALIFWFISDYRGRRRVDPNLNFVQASNNKGGKYVKIKK